MAKEKSNFLPVRPEARPERKPAVTAEVIRFPGDWEQVDATKTGGGDVSGWRGKVSWFDLYMCVTVVGVVLSPRFWLNWAMHFGTAVMVATAAMVAFTTLLIWLSMPNIYQFITFILFVSFIVSALYVLFMVTTAVMCAVLIWIRHTV